MGDSVLSPSPPVARAMNRVRRALEILGHEVVEWTYPEPRELETLFDELVHIAGDRGEGGRSALTALSLSLLTPRIQSQKNSQEEMNHGLNRSARWCAPMQHYPGRLPGTC
jgi:hypothetical protein